MKWLCEGKISYVLIWFFSVGIFLFHYFISGQAVYGDGIDYWAYLHTWYLDQDINFANEFRHVYGPIQNNSVPEQLAPDILKMGYTIIGKVDNIHPFGTALLLLPFYIFADIVIMILNLVGFNLIRNGYSDIYQIICGLGAVLYGVIGLITLENLSIKLGFTKKISRVSIITVWAASSLVYYTSYDVLNSHFASFFVISLFWYYFVTHFRYRFLKHYLFLGLFIGLASLIRLQEVLFIVPVILELLYARFKSIITTKEMLLLSLTLGISLTIMLIPLMIQWINLYGSILNYTEIINLRPKSRGIFDSLLYYQTGLFSATPLLAFLLLFIPVAGINKQTKTFLTLSGIVFILHVLILARHGGWVGSAYGGRMYISSIPFFTVLLCGALTYSIKHSFLSKLLLLCIIFFVFYNIVNIGRFIFIEKEASGGRRGIENSTIQRIEKIAPWFPKFII